MTISVRSLRVFETKGNDHEFKALLIDTKVFLISTTGIVKRTVWTK